MPDSLPPKDAGAACIGAGFKPRHAGAVLDPAADRAPDVDFFEVHAENYMGAGGPPHAQLRALAERYPLSVHGVGLSIGSAGPLDEAHLERLKRVVERYRPMLVSEHLAWSTHREGYLNDLLAVAYTGEVLTTVTEHIDRVQTALGRTMLLENPATYIRFEQSTWDEVDFIREVQRRTGCGLLLDVNNVQVSAVNQGFDPHVYLNRFPVHSVAEIHLAGHAEGADGSGRPLLIDAHDRPPSADVMTLFATASSLVGSVPTLIEWDNDVPEWPVLEEEVRRARAVAVQVIEARKRREALDVA